MQSTRVVGFIGLALCATAQAGPTALTVKDAAAGQGNNPYTPLLFTIERTGDLSYPIELEFESAPDPDAATPATADVDFLARHVPAYELSAGQAAPTLPVSMVRAAPASPNRGLKMRVLGAVVPPFRPRQELCSDRASLDVAVADFNGDGRQDLAVVQSDGDWQLRLRACLNEGSGATLAFSAPQLINSDALAVAAGDLDGDGRHDLAFTGDNSVIVVLNRTAPGANELSFTAPRVLYKYNAFGAIVLADFNGDGRLDIAAGQAGGSCTSTCEPAAVTSELEVFFNTTPIGAPEASFERLGPIVVPAFVQRMVVADFDGDDRTDLALATSYGGVVLLRNATLAAGSAPTFEAPRQLLEVEFMAGLDVADFNRDGRPDLVAVHTYDVSILTNLGGGDWSEPETIYVEPRRSSGHQEQPFIVVAGDFSGDGLPDLAIAHYLVHTTDVNGFGDDDSLVMLLLNRTPENAQSHRFRTWHETEVSGVPWTLALADLNGDGRDDLIAPSMFEGHVTVLARTDHSVEFARGEAKGTALATLPPLQMAPVSDATASTMVASEELVISGITYAAPITVAQGSYTVNGVQRTGLSYVSAGDVVRVQVQAPAGANAQGKASLMIGGVGGEFSVTTTATATADGGSAGGGVPLATLAVLLLAALGRARRSHREAAFQ